MSIQKMANLSDMRTAKSNLLKSMGRDLTALSSGHLKDFFANALIKDQIGLFLNEF
jgi:hypothetical protein